LPNDCPKREQIKTTANNIYFCIFILLLTNYLYAKFPTLIKRNNNVNKT